MDGETPHVGTTIKSPFLKIQTSDILSMNHGLSFCNWSADLPNKFKLIWNQIVLSEKAQLSWNDELLVYNY